MAGLSADLRPRCGSICASQYFERLDNFVHVTHFHKSFVLVIGDDKNAGKTRFANSDIFPYAD